MASVGQQRVTESRRSLHCDACGAGNPLTAQAIELGWFRCLHCEGAAPVAGAGAFALEAPGGGVTRLVRRGGSLFESADELVAPLKYSFPALIVADLLGGGGVALAQHLMARPPVWLEPAMLVAVAYAAVVIFAAAYIRQRIEVGPERIDVWWTSFGLRWNHRHLDTRRFRTRAKIEGRSGVALETPAGEVFVWVEGETAVRWLQHEIEAAVEDAHSWESLDMVPCPACGGPVTAEKTLRDEGGAECPHCRTGLLHTGGGIALPAAEIGHRLAVPDGAEAARPRRRDGLLEWTGRSFFSCHPWASLLVNLPLSMAFDVAVLGFFVWAIWATPVAKVVVTTLGLVAVYGLCEVNLSFYAWVFGRHRFRLGPTRLEHEMFIGPWLAARHGIALARLVSLEAFNRIIELGGDGDTVRAESQRLALAVQTAVRKLELEVYGRENRPMVRALVEALPERLEALGRRVSRTGRLAAR